ncbi:Alpha/Beta hydrolase protein [Dactylonectria estremocensis]|uniref:Alpha/Beta hydrolase protein n=1 Tax=Dactylonectria estremocensis TaxID=1079267 RepID=A0A9P9FFC1_9HYPO|nr:Alpha/Beta hydrolase protein [Dactylonectria estremocensis]
MMSPSDRFELLESTPRSSLTVFNIAGFHVYLYGVDELSAEQAKDTTVLFHIHGRTRTYKDAEEVAHHLISECRARGPTKKGLVVATLDNRNHGSRAIDKIAIQDWEGGNPRHAQDMLSMMDGIVADVQTIITFLESYVEGLFTPTKFIVTGTSLGGHVAWDILARDDRVNNGIIIVGSPNLTDMLVERLDRYTSTTDGVTGSKEWPKSIEKLYLARDKRLEEISGKEFLILNGAIDPLVPAKFTLPWVQKFGANNKVTLVEQEDNGHWVSLQMMEKMVNWVMEALA